MQRLIFLLSFLIIISCFRVVQAQEMAHLSVPTPFIQGVNVMTGQADSVDHPDIHYDFYQTGWNQLMEESIFLLWGDFRIGRVKTIHSKSSDAVSNEIHFLYEKGATKVYDTPERASIYRYTDQHLLQAVEHYERKNEKSLEFYRCERLFWQDAKPFPHLISRVLEDRHGTAILCYSFFYNEQGQLIKETLFGNLSGNCQIPCKMGKKGYPESNGVESYSIHYLYSKDDPQLLMTQIQDNGLITTYQYDSPTKQCTGKLIGYDGGLLSRCFYIYDQEGFLEKTIVDDGQGQHSEDLKGVTQRQIIYSEIGRQLSVLGQPLKVESHYWDLASQQEKGLEGVHYFYSDRGLLLQQDFHDGNGTLRYDLRFNYDSEGHLESTVDSREEMPLKEETPIQERFNEWEQKVATIDTYGNETHYTYDAFGRLVSTHFPAVLDAWDASYHPEIKQSYNICDQVTEMIDPKGEKTTINYNIRGKPVRITYPDGSYESFSYFLDGAVKEKRTREGTTFSFTRDKGCRVVRSEKYSLSGNLLQTLEYTYQGELVQTVTDGETFTMHFLYDGAGRQIGSSQETRDGVRRLEWTYDACGQKSQVREWFGPSSEDFVAKIEEKGERQSTQSTRFEDSKGEFKYTTQHAKSSTDFVFSQATTALNSLGQYVKQEEKVDGYGIRYILIYDALGRLETLVKYNAMGEKIAETQLRYDAQGNKILEKHQVIYQGHLLRIFTIRWDYDACKRLLAVTESSQDQIKTTRYQYNAQGQIEQVIKPDGIVLHYSYHPDGQLARFEASDHSFAYDYRYDHLQRLIAIHDLCHHVVQTRHYNDFHELIEEEQASDLKLHYQYDLAGRRTSLTLPDNSGVRYHYQGPLLDSIERLGKDEESLYQHSYEYDVNGRLTMSHLLNELGTVRYQYNDKGRVMAIQSPWWSQQIDQEQGFDPYGRIVNMKIQDSQGSYSSSFIYQDDGQLVEEDGHQYTYDSLFNRLSDNGQKWEVNALNQITRSPQTSYVYDVNGNLIEKHEKNESVFYTYDALNRLVRIEYPGKNALTYFYDAFHRRIGQQYWNWQDQQKTWSLQSSEKFIYDGYKEIGKVNQQGQLIHLRLLGQGQGAELGAAVALELEGKLFVPVHDDLGSVRCAIDAESGEIVESYRYSAYGLETLYDGNGHLLNQSAINNPWRFCSKRIDEESRLIFFGKRYYDPSMGRWMTPDPLCFYDSPNLYAFVKNDPVNCYDLYGLFSISQIWDRMVNSFFSCFQYLQISAHNAKLKLNAELKLPAPISTALEKIGKTLFGESTYLLMGPHFEETHVNYYGEREISDKVRVTFINGILNTRNAMLHSLAIISEAHGGVKVHYVYRPTEGWTWDISRGIMIKVAFALGFRSMHAHLLAQLWRDMIEEMGGLEGGGTIVHYAHSMGGSETDRARGILTPEEQKMIRVITFGSATLLLNVGFQSVINIVSVNDGVSSFILEPIGHIRYYFDPNSNVNFQGSFLGSPLWPTDHLLNGPTYGPILRQFGEQFLAEFSPTN